MSNDTKLWLQRDIQTLAKAAALEAIQSQGGLALPCQVIALNPNNPATGTPLGYSFVQVQFEVNVPYTKPDGTMGTYTLPPLILPKAESQWVRSPTQVGDMGMTQALDTSHGGVSGMSAGVADTGTDYGNLSTLVFVPVGNANFAASPDPNKAWMNGVAGAVVSDTAQTATMTASLNNVTHIAGSGANQVKTIVDGAGRAISHIVPTGGILGLGALASGLAATRAVPAQADLTTLSNNLIATSLQTMATAIGVAAQTAAMPNAAAFHTILSASGFITGLSGINPTIPSGSSLVRVAP